MKYYWIKVDPPEYQIGYGPDHEFVVVARMSSQVRAVQITRLLNQDEVANGRAIAAMIKQESDYINSSCTLKG